MSEEKHYTQTDEKKHRDMCTGQNDYLSIIGRLSMTFVLILCRIVNTSLRETKKEIRIGTGVRNVFFQ